MARIPRTYKVRIAHVPTKKLRHALVNVKDALKKERYPGVVYCIPCADCDDVYIGETGNFERRLEEHFNDVKNKKMDTNAIAEHAVSTGHDIDWGPAHVLATEKRLFRRVTWNH